MDAGDPQLDDVLERARRTIPGCVAIACVDTRLGMLLHARTEPDQAADAIDMVTAAMGELFRDANARALDGVFRRLLGQTPAEQPQMQQVFALSSSHIYVYQSLATSPELVLATVCHAHANLGMVLARAKAALVELQAVSETASAANA